MREDLSILLNIIYRYLDCGDPHNGFARVKCKDCNHEYLLAFSCKRRHFCPSCHQKRVVEFGEWLCTCLAPPLELKKLETIFRHKVFCMLIARGKISREMIAMLATWRHSGFHVFCGNHIQPKEDKATETLLRYIIRNLIGRYRLHTRSSLLGRSHQPSWGDYQGNSIPEIGGQPIKASEKEQEAFSNPNASNRTFPKE